MGEGKMKRGEVLCSIIAQPITFLSFFHLIQAIGTHCSNKLKLIVTTVCNSPFQQYETHRLKSSSFSPLPSPINPPLSVLKISINTLALIFFTTYLFTLIFLPSLDTKGG